MKMYADQSPQIPIENIMDHKTLLWIESSSSD